ncbi:dephospho-CoA kinase [Flavobacteriales bacterium]|nr:dephospho-CoA kinase [Flavobacteriales bacterium]
MSLSTPQDNNVYRTGAVVVGLTGGIGVGKSVVAQILRTLGHPVFDADAAARELYDKDASLLQAVADRFGSGVLGADGRLNRSVLAALVFNDPNALADLNAMVHPAVAKAFLSWKSSVERNGAVVVFREAAILFESGSNADCDWVWAVSAPWSLRLQRVQNRNGWSVDEVEVRAGHQWPAEKVMAGADKVILNDGSTALVPRVLSLLDELF